MIIIALGANLPGPCGSPEETLKEALRLLEGKGVRVVKASKQWLTEPVPVSGQPWFRNAAAVIETDLAPRALMVALKAVERKCGRRDSGRNAPRVLDLDLIAYNDIVIIEKDLMVPHPRMHERAFVLYPLQEIAPGWRHPVLQKSLKFLIGNLPPGQKIERLEDAA